ncbi:MAG: riboflavin synthase [Rhodocyclaceae bacterium]|nr:riboflavin synthase [Rhodocyclaceae bacterium]
MFSGMVAAVGRIEAVTPSAGGARLRVAAGALELADVALGDSIAVNGCCLTVVAREGEHLGFDVSAETLRCTSGLDAPAPVNLEKSLRLADRLGGHLVTGHVDGTGTVLGFEPLGDNRRLTVALPRALARFVAPKGSVAVQGVSLTVNRVADAAVAGDPVLAALPPGHSAFQVNLIPHTLAVTTLGALAPGARVNLEVDLLARYAARFDEASAA